MIPADFMWFMPMPNFNDLEKPLKLDHECIPYMRDKAQELISMWLDCKRFNYKPSDFREGNEIYTEDLRAFRMLDSLEIDAEKYSQSREKVEQKNREYIASEQAKFRASKGRRR